MDAFRRLAAVFLAALLLAAPALAQAPAAADAPLFKLEKVGQGVYAAIGGPMAGSNAGFVVGDDGVLVIDAFFDPEAAKALLVEIRKLTDKPIRYVVNTHYHIDHVRGDAVFKAEGATIVAHKNVPGWIHPGNIHLLGGDKIQPQAKADVDALILPDETVDKLTVLTVGRRPVELYPMDGHTGGDLAVNVPDAKVMFTGDILWNRDTPNLTDGNTGRWLANLELLAQMPDTIFVPGHGGVSTVREVEAMRRLLTDLRAWTAQARKQGLHGARLQAQVAAKLKASYGQWSYMDSAAPTLADLMEQELAGTKRVPIPAP